MRFKAGKKEDGETCGETGYNVQLYSRRASLVSEFCLDAEEHNLTDLEGAAEYVREALAPCDFASTIVIVSDEDSNDEASVQFELNPS